jgi:hypothetical protein
MVDPMDAAGTGRHLPKYLAVAGYLLSTILAAVGLHRLGLRDVGLAAAVVVAAVALLWVAFLPLFRRLHDATA